MDVLLTEEQDMIRTAAREFLEGECTTKLVRDMEADPVGYPPGLWKKAAELGWQGMCLPEDYGGSGLPLVYLGLVLQEVGRAVAPLPLHSTTVAALTIARDGTEAQRQAILPAVVRGEMVLTWAITERDGRHFNPAIETTAVVEGDEVVINGTKLFVDNFPAADHCLVACRTGEGLSLFLVDTRSPGISQRSLVTTAKDRQSEVIFKDVRVPVASRIGPLNEAGPIIEVMLDRASVLLCAQMLGATRKDAEMAIDYAKMREAFGQPIGAFQSVQHMCADMIIWIDGGELLTYEALWRMDQGLPHSVEVSQAKAFCNDRCEAVVRNAQIIHGGIGFMMEFDLHLWFRRVSSWTMRLGTSYEHRARIAKALIDLPGRVILGRPVPVVMEETREEELRRSA
ncbi:acyl-CoA dehydrogenase [Agaricicola taiwanensis]|uniref:Acyl-CoA dehydrogenase n=1 Tax=Agaricicola taiwanensis TaxID=591372 RepID=A0A8J3DWS3_9RHOB|nr:acyl-CoA dehydrogenase family protein [Agaricicola taiwanensis]GGE50211.1 acyl-CoA dehydrogenase [Agaricicola taiwanensis]